MTAGLGHNNGPAMDAGVAWRKHCWTKARRDLIPHLPIEILRARVRRAQEIGLDYKTYASVRASTGRDVVGFLFSSNALRLIKGRRKIPAKQAEKLTKIIDCDRLAFITQQLSTAEILQSNAKDTLDGAYPAPNPFDNWPTCRQAVQSALSACRLPADGVLLIGDTTLEREWSTAGKLAGYLSADRYFAEYRT